MHKAENRSLLKIVGISDIKSKVRNAFEFKFDCLGNRNKSSMTKLKFIKRQKNSFTLVSK